MVSRVVVLVVVLSGCSTVAQVNDYVVDSITTANTVQYQTAELIMCRGISIGEWMRSIAPYPEKVTGWRALCVGSELPKPPVED